MLMRRPRRRSPVDPIEQALPFSPERTYTAAQWLAASPTIEPSDIVGIDVLPGRLGCSRGSRFRVRFRTLVAAQRHAPGNAVVPSS